MFNFFRKRKKKTKKITLEVPVDSSKEEILPGIFRIPNDDIELIKFIRCTIAKGIPVTIHPNTQKSFNEENAVTLRDSYGLTDYEVLVETGIWIGDRDE